MSSPTEEGSEKMRLGPLHLANALAACVLSGRLASHHRQWAAEQLVKTLAAQVSLFIARKVITFYLISETNISVYELLL